MASTWLAVLTFGNVICNPSGSGPASSRVLRNRSSVRSPRRRVGSSRHLNRRPTKAGAVPSPIALARSPATRTASVSSTSSWPGTVAVFEVESEVLDGLTAQLGDHLGRHLTGQIVGQAELGTQPLNPAVLVDEGGGRLPHWWQVRGVLVGRHVDGVHRLPAAVLAGVGAGEEGVGGGQPLVDPGKDLLGKPDRHRDGRTGSGHFTSSYAGSVRKSVKSSLRHKSLINFLAGWQ